MPLSKLGSMHERTLQAFVDELGRIQGVEKTAMPTGKDIKKLLLKGTRPLRRGLKQAKTVKERIDAAARNAAIHGYVKGGKPLRTVMNIGEEAINMGPPLPPKRHL